MAEAPEETQAPEGAAAGLCGVAGGSTWWGGLIKTAKEKSVSALEFVKKDISEFTNTMHSDSESMACNVRSTLTQETATTAKEKMKQGVSYLFEGIKTVLIIPPEDMDEDEAEAITICSSKHIFDKAKARLHAIQIDPETYCNEPSGSSKDFDMWKSSMDLDGMKGDISELLVANVEVRALYTRMVPSSVSHADFWQRYFYKMHHLEQEEQRRADLMKRADDTQETNDLDWGDEDEEDAWDMATNGSEDKKSPPETPDNKDQESEPTPPQSDTESPASQHSSTEKLIDTVPGVTSATSPSETLSSLSTATYNSEQDMPKDSSSAETLTIVSADSSSSSPQVSPTETSKDQLKVKEKGDLVMVSGENVSDRTISPSTSESNSHNKESLDEDWEKDFDIEVTEDDIRQAQEEGVKDTPAREGDEDWENWE